MQHLTHVYRCLLSVDRSRWKHKKLSANTVALCFHLTYRHCKDIYRHESGRCHTFLPFLTHFIITSSFSSRLPGCLQSAGILFRGILLLSMEKVNAAIFVCLIIHKINNLFSQHFPYSNAIEAFFIIHSWMDIKCSKTS